jgi:hypothetical protein
VPVVTRRRRRGNLRVIGMDVRENPLSDQEAFFIFDHHLNSDVAAGCSSRIENNGR